VDPDSVTKGMEGAADRLLEKLRRFIATELEPDERAMFATLLAPGVARAHSDEEVAAFGVTAWSPASLPDALADALDREDVRVSGLGL